MLIVSHVCQSGTIFFFSREKTLPPRELQSQARPNIRIHRASEWEGEFKFFLVPTYRLKLKVANLKINGLTSSHKCNVCINVDMLCLSFKSWRGEDVSFLFWSLIQTISICTGVHNQQAVYSYDNSFAHNFLEHSSLE